MAPPEPPPLPATAATAGAGTTPQPAASTLIPNHLRPPWRDLPALARLTVRRLHTRLQAIPVLGHLAAWCAAPLMLLTLACAHADRHLAAQDRHTAIWLRQLSPTGRGIHTLREPLMVAAAVLPLAPVLLLAIAIGTDPHTIVLIRVAALAIAVTIMAGPLLAFFAVNRWRDLTTRTGPQHRRLAAQNRTPLVVVQGFVADTGAGTTLVRALRAHADRLGVGIAAVARDEHLLRGYRANGFTQTEPDPASRLLFRPPNASNRDHPVRSERRAPSVARTSTPGG